MTPPSLCRPLPPWLLALLACLLIALLSGCQLRSSKALFASANEPEPLKVGISPDHPPLIMKKNGQIAGLELHFAQGLARSLNRPLQLIEYSRQELVGALQKKRIDIIMSAMSETTAQEQQLATTEPYLISGQVALVHLDDFSQLGTGYDHLRGDAIRLGVVKGSPGEELMNRLHPKGTVHQYAASLSGLQALMMDRIDVFIHDLPTSNYYAAQFIEQGLTPGTTLLSREPLAWAVLPNNTELRQAANAYLQQLQAEGKLATMLSQHLPFYRDTAYSPR